MKEDNKSPDAGKAKTGVTDVVEQELVGDNDEYGTSYEEDANDFVDPDEKYRDVVESATRHWRNKKEEPPKMRKGSDGKISKANSISARRPRP